MEWQELLKDGLYALYDLALLRPIRRLYVSGPEYVGWGGKEESQICSILSNTPVYIWDRNYKECSEMIENKVASLLVLVETILYLLLLYKFACSLISYWIFDRNASVLMRKLISEEPRPCTSCAAKGCCPEM